MSDTTIDYVDRRSRLPQRAGEEELRFIRNFHDVFISIGIGLFGVGIGFVSVLLLGDMVSINEFSDLQEAGWLIAGVALINALIMWGLAEFFARHRRLFLPAIVILVFFTWFFASGATVGYLTLFGEGDIADFEDAQQKLRFFPLTVAGATTLAIFVYYARMKLPFAMGLGGVGLAATGVAGLAALDAELILSLGFWLQLLAGLFLFALGVMFDARDPQRQTRFSDNGFWLHFFAAPLIFNSVLVLTTGRMLMSRIEDGAIGDGGLLPTAVVTLVLVILFAVVSLLINRRALLVAGLLSAAYAIWVVVNSVGLSGAWPVAVTLLVLGASMVLLGGGWHSVRRVLVAPFPKEGLIARIIPPEPGPGETVDDRVDMVRE